MTTWAITVEHAIQASIGSIITRGPGCGVSHQAASTTGIPRTIAAKARRHRLR
jgi:hypothetical protein